ncbi:MAG: efflux RND transporter periplasmic adaptor subunit [Bryobacter sp.]|nr:efflux RND transporter periplasmic adaptor subunit [Bryobacter sp.]
MKPLSLLLLACAVSAQTPETTTVVGRAVERTRKLPGEFLPYQAVDLHARLTGYVEDVRVDRGSVVAKGDVLVRLSAPEMDAQAAEAAMKVKTIEAQQAEAQARLAAAQATYERLAAAAKTPGAVAGNEVITAEKAVEAARGLIRSLEASANAAREAVKSMAELMKYRVVTAPFDGVITARLVHPGALATTTSGPLLRLEQVARLRLVVAVPEGDLGVAGRGAAVRFTLPSLPGETFSGTIARTARSLDARTRTMPVELDVANSSGRLAPGMYPEVEWPLRRAVPSLLVPPTAVATTTEKSFVIRVENGRARHVPVRKGAVSGDLVEVFGDLKPGDVVIRRATDEIRDGSPLGK